MRKTPAPKTVCSAGKQSAKNRKHQKRQRRKKAQGFGQHQSTKNKLSIRNSVNGYKIVQPTQKICQ